ncbi:MAG: ABC transporter permease [Anaerolineaceae bacterium]|nr:ABC transporter permease [Anaerolineaceae bacterium]
MNRWKFLTDAVESFSANKLRTALTMLGIVIGVAAVISMLAVGQGASSSITSNIESMGTNLLYVMADNDVTNPQPLTLADAEAITESGGAPSVMAVAPNVSRSMDVTFAGTSTTTTILGVTPNYSTVRNETVASGRFITQADIDGHATVAVIGSDVVDELFSTSVGVLGQKIRIGSNLYQVVGILESKGGTSVGSSDNQVIVPITTAQVRIITRSDAHDEVSQISVAVVDAEHVASAITEVTSILHSRHDIRSDADDDFRIMSQEAFTEAATQITGVLTIFLGGIAGISLLVGGIGIMNIMLVSVIERTKEIGLRKAVGARDNDIMLQFLMESLIIGLAGGLLGVLAGWGISSLISSVAAFGSTSLNAEISLSSVLLAVGFSVAVGLVFGLYPANRAAKLEPVEALRTE